MFVRVSGLTSGEHQLFDDDPTDRRSVRIFRSELEYQWEVVDRLRIGGAAGWMRISADGVSPIHRLTLTPSVTVRLTPNRRGFRLSLRAAGTYLPTGLSGADFGNSVTTFKTESEFVPTFAFIVGF